MKPKKENGFEKREKLGAVYWTDKRWEEVIKLRNKGKNLEANGLVMAIRMSWGLE